MPLWIMPTTLPFVHPDCQTFLQPHSYQKFVQQIENSQLVLLMIKPQSLSCISQVSAIVCRRTYTGVNVCRRQRTPAPRQTTLSKSIAFIQFAMPLIIIKHLNSFLLSCGIGNITYLCISDVCNIAKKYDLKSSIS